MSKELDRMIAEYEYLCRRYAKWTIDWQRADAALLALRALKERIGDGA